MLNYSLNRSSEPAVEPVELSAVKSALRITGNASDDELSSLVSVARRVVERDSRRSLITQTWQLKLDAWPLAGIRLLMPPVQSVSSIKYVDTGGTTQTWSSDEYDVFTDDEPGLVLLGYQKTWPTLRGDRRGITVEYVAGYGDTAASVPEALQRAIIEFVRMQFDGLYEELMESYKALVQGEMAGTYP
jgi:uncharacterized phiE125 gp8 family phage protein